MQKIERLVAITLLLQARGKMTAQRLAAILGVSVRTIYRDIETLSLAHVPVSMDYGPGGGYYLPDDYHFESAVFTREEAVSLVLGVDMAGNYSLFADDDGLHRALFKLEAALPEEYRSDVQLAREHILFDTTEWHSRTTTAGYLETIRAAVMEARQLDILYLHTSCAGIPSVQWRNIEPYGLVYKGRLSRHVRTGVWYLVAYCLTSQDVRTFRVSQIENLRVRQEQITMRPDFDLQLYWQEARKHIEERLQNFALTLRVTPSARYALRGHYTIMQEEADGNALVRVHVESAKEAVSYVLALGLEATVLSPATVREAVAAAAQSIAELYNQSNCEDSFDYQEA